MWKRLVLFFVLLSALGAMAFLLQLASESKTVYPQPGQMNGAGLFELYCISCHGAGGSGTQKAPALQPERYSTEYVATTIVHGNARMPGYPDMPQELVRELVEYVKSLK